MGVVSLSSTSSSSSSTFLQLFQSQQQSSPPLLRGGGGGGGAFSTSTRRTHICFPQRRRRLLFLRVKSVQSSSIVDGLQSFRVVPSTADKEEVKAVLTMFLKNEIGLSNEAIAGTISNSVPFIHHLLARLHSIHKSRYLVGKELTTLEIRDALIPYLEYLCEENEHSLDDVIKKFRNPPDEERQDHRDNMHDVMENFRNPPDEEREDHRDGFDDVVESFPNSPEEEQKRYISEASPTKLPLIYSKKLKAMARMTEIGTDGQLHPNTLYLLDIGLDMDQIKRMACRYPSITCPGWGRNLKPLVEFFLDLGVLPSDIPSILYKAPKLCTLRLSENIIPYMAYLETLGLDKSKWVKVIKRFPNLLLCSKRKVTLVVDYLYELGLSRDRIGKVLTTNPMILALSIDDNLRPTAEYFGSMGVNLTSLFSHHPGVFYGSMECQLKPVTEFFLDKGFSIEEIGFMVSRFGSIYRYSLTTNLIPKWDFFLTMDYPISKLVQYPNYFGFSLEGRIKPRYSQMRECGVKLSLRSLLGESDSKFKEFLNRRSMKKGFTLHA